MFKYTECHVQTRGIPSHCNCQYGNLEGSPDGGWGGGGGQR